MSGIEGWKTKAAAVGAILGGVSIIIKSVIDLDFSGVEAGYAMIISGLAVLGIGHKLDKAKQATIAQTEALKQVK